MHPSSDANPSPNPEPAPDAPGDSDPDQPPTFDIEAARMRYRRMMRGRVMRAVLVFTVSVIVLSWVFAFAAVYASDVERLPGHDITVSRQQCIACHVDQVEPAPPMPHPAAPTCGFCHVQGLPPR